MFGSRSEKKRICEAIEAHYAHGLISRLYVDGPLEEAFESNKALTFTVTVKQVLGGRGVEKVAQLSLKELRRLDQVRAAFFGSEEEFQRIIAAADRARRETLLEIRAEAGRIDSNYEEKLAEGRRKQEETLRWLEEGLVALPEGGLAEWIKTQPPDVWHEIATNYNWDHGLEVLRWIAAQPNCDIATAMWIFLAGDPAYFGSFASREDVSDHARDQFDMMDMIATNVCRGFYERQVFACDLSKWRYDFARQKALAAEGKLARWFLPEEAFGPFAGRPHDSPYVYDSEDLRTRRD